MQDMGQTCVCKGSTNAALRAHVNMQSIIPFHRRTMVSSRESCLVYKSKEESFCSLFVSCCILRKGDCVCFFRTIIDDRYHRVTMGVCVFLLECATAYKPPNATSLLKRQSTPLNFFLKCGAMELCGDFTVVRFHPASWRPAMWTATTARRAMRARAACKGPN